MLPARQILGIGISVVCLALVFRKIDFAQMVHSFQNFRWHFLAFGLVLLAIDYGARIRRWAVMLRTGGANVTNWACAAPFIGSIALNNVMPLRAGDLVRALVFPAAIGVGRVTATASLLLERLVDTLTLLLCLGTGLLLSPAAQLPGWLAHSVIALAIGASIALVAIVTMNASLERLLRRLQGGPLERHASRAAKAAGVLADLVHDVGEMSRPRVLMTLSLYSAVVWIGETGLFWSVLYGVGIHVDFPDALAIMALATLSTLVPSSPGYVGPFHLVAWSAAQMFGGSAAQAASFALLTHLGLWLPTTLAGSIAILAKPELFRGRAVMPAPLER